MGQVLSLKHLNKWIPEGFVIKDFSVVFVKDLSIIFGSVN